MSCGPNCGPKPRPQPRGQPACSVQTRPTSCQPVTATIRGARSIATWWRVIYKAPAPPAAKTCPSRQQQAPPSSSERPPPPLAAMAAPQPPPRRARHGISRKIRVTATLGGGRKRPPAARPPTAMGRPPPTAPRKGASAYAVDTTRDGGQPREECVRPGKPAASTVRSRGESGGATPPLRRREQCRDGQRGG